LNLFKDHGATRMVENWGDGVPGGTVTDFHRAVQKRDGEAVLFSWVEWPSEDLRDAGMKALEQDERMQTLVMPFDGKRMIFGGFSPVVEEGAATMIGYVDGIAAPVPMANQRTGDRRGGGRADRRRRRAHRRSRAVRSRPIAAARPGAVADGLDRL
jgi:uncharacterized protein YbaA (DUF1428 family)